MRRLKLTTLLSYIIVVYVFVWVYYLAFNWDLFSVNLKTNLGFAVIQGYPFIFFSAMGFLALLIARLYAQYIRMGNERLLQEKTHRAKILEKELEIVRIKSQNNQDGKEWDDEITELNHKIDDLKRRLDAETKSGRDTPPAKEK